MISALASEALHVIMEVPAALVPAELARVLSTNSPGMTWFGGPQTVVERLVELATPSLVRLRLGWDREGRSLAAAPV